MESSIESDSDDLQTPMERMDRLEVLANKLTYPLTFPKEIVWDKGNNTSLLIHYRFNFCKDQAFLASRCHWIHENSLQLG